MIKVFIDGVVDDVLGVFFSEPFGFFYPASSWYMHRGVHVLEKEIMQHRRDDKYPHEEMTSENIANRTTDHESNERDGDKEPVGCSDAVSMIFILKAFRSTIPRVMIDMRFTLTEEDTELAVLHRAMNNPL